ncbi:hypothetical protein A4X06_0g6662 [Tilletia controversa]|uniref:Major facilitator superfamily (MFS) profile domain-containing protein n=2 Tax=Tilletia TaxID=13289 RepID=A0A8X7MP23_9BASI|nr:hypothetical protein A4X06_0g6662 [Tilletia controversa]KAE8265249.1 hypothetical protein A4X03_0g391 [Tilletia caries]
MTDFDHSARDGRSITPATDAPILPDHNSAYKDADGDGDGEGRVGMRTDSNGVPLPPGVDEKKLMRKVDLTLIPWLSFLYLLSFLDRSAIGNASLYGLSTDLNLTPQQLNICITVFFFTYSPTNLLLKRLRPSVVLSTITFFVGICMMGQGFARSYGGLIAARLCLGIAEAGLFPGVNFMLSGWYRRNEFGLRAAIFFSAATASGSCGGLLSAAIQNMDGVGGLEGWRWIFIIIGIVTSIAGLASFYLVQDFPDNAKCLTEPERKYLLARLAADNQFSSAGEPFRWRHVARAFLDAKTYVGMLAYAGADAPLYAFSLFTPKIIQQLGYTSTRANLLSVPIYVLACIVTCLVGFIANKKGNRPLLNLICQAAGIVGYIVLIVSRNPTVSYIFIYIAALGVYPCIANTIAMTSGVEGIYKRSAVMGIVISFGNLNGAVSSNIYRNQDRPWYPLGHGIVLLYLGIGVITTSLYWWMIADANRRKARGEYDETILDPSLSEAEVEAALEKAKEEGRRRDAADGIVGRIRAVYRRLDMLPGGTYASVEQAKLAKGDHWSGYQYHI